MTAKKIFDMFVDMLLYMALMQSSLFKKDLEDIFKDGQNFCENNNLPILCLSHGKKASSSTTFYKKMKK